MNNEYKSIIEGILFAAGEAISVNEISQAIDLNQTETKKILIALKDEYDYNRRGIQIKQINTKFQMCTRPEHYTYVSKLMNERNKSGLSQASLETLAIIAYKQPVTRMEIEMMRGVKSSSSVQTILDRDLIKEVGRMEAPGKPKLYGTTTEFLKYIGLSSINELPDYEEFVEGRQEKMNEC